MESSLSPGKRILVIGGMLLVIILAIVTAILSNKKTVPQQSKVPPGGTKNVTPADIQRILAYKPPAGATYTALGDVNYLPGKVNNMTINQSKVLQQAKDAYPNLSESELIRTVNTSLFTFLAMNDFYSRNGIPTSDLYKKASIDSFSQLDTEVHNQALDYEKKLLSLNGFFFKVQFNNVRPDNMAQLNVKESDLRRLANNLINKYLNAAKGFRDKSRVVDFINRDKQVELLNNGDKAKTFSNYKLYQPLVGYPNFYRDIQNVKVANFSDVITFQQYVPGKTSLQDTGFVVFYISGKSGSYLPLQILRDMYISKAVLQ